MEKRISKNVNEGATVLHLMTQEQIEALAADVAKKVAAIYAQTPVETSTGTAWISRQEAAAKLGISLPTLHKFLNSGAVNYRKVGARTLIDENDLLTKLADGKLSKYRRNDGK